MMKTGPRIITVANQKGGVGKTTTAINLATALAAIGEKVLIVDLDPQGNASTGLGIDRKDRTVSSYDVLTGELDLEEAAMPTAVPGLSIVPSTLDLLGIEMEIASAPDRVLKLRNALRAATERGAPFGYVLIDCPPSLNLLTLNSMAAADSVLVPLQCEFFALEGLSQLLETVEQVRRSINPDLIIQGIVLTMYDGRNNLANQVVAGCAGAYGRQGLRDHHSAQCAGVRGAVLRQAGDPLRPEMLGQPGLSAAGIRSDPPRAQIARRLIGRSIKQADSIPKRLRTGIEMSEDLSRKRLGRGLAALIGEIDRPAAAEKPGLNADGKVPIEFLSPNPKNPRRHFGDAELTDLAQSIREHGVVQPVVARPSPTQAGRYEIIAGERRWRAAQRAGLTEIPIIVRDVNDRTALELAIIENVQRTDLNPVEEALGYQQLIDDHGYTQADLGNVIGKSRSHVANTLRLLKLPDVIRDMLVDGALSAGHARTLVTARGSGRPCQADRRRGSFGAPGRSAGADAGRRHAAQGQAGASRSEKDADTLALEKLMTDTIGMIVTIEHKGKGGAHPRGLPHLEQLDELCRRLKDER